MIQRVGFFYNHFCIAQFIAVANHIDKMLRNKYSYFPCLDIDMKNT